MIIIIILILQSILQSIYIKQSVLKKKIKWNIYIFTFLNAI